MNPVEESLTILSEKVGDPTAPVYERLFKTHPDVEPLFLLDRTDAAKGEMLSQILAAILDFSENRHYAENLIGTEMVNHSQLGVDPTVFRDFFNLIRDFVREQLADAWTQDMEQDWQGLLNEFDRIIEAELAIL